VHHKYLRINSSPAPPKKAKAKTTQKPKKEFKQTAKPINTEVYFSAKGIHLFLL